MTDEELISCLRSHILFNDAPISEAADRIEALTRERDGWRMQIGRIAALVPIPEVISATGTIGDLINWITDRVKRA